MMVKPTSEGGSVGMAVAHDASELANLLAAANGEFYDCAAKRDPALRSYHCPATLSGRTAAFLGHAAVEAHGALGCDGYSRSDFIVTPDGAVYWLEANSLPGLSRAGNLATMAATAGIPYDELVIHILATAKRRRRYTP